MPTEEEIICCKKYLEEGVGVTSSYCAKITGKTTGNSSRQLKGSQKTGNVFLKIETSRKKYVFYPTTELLDRYCKLKKYKQK